MSIEIVVPEMGESVIEATVRAWLKKEGDFVEAGEALVELETDKVNLEVGAKASGVLAKIQVGEGQDVKVGDVVLYAKYAGTEVKINDKKLLILKESDILAIVEK